MKKFFTMLLLTLTMSMTMQAQNETGFGNDFIFASDNFVDIDKQYHFVGGAGFGFVGYLAGLDIYDGDRVKAIWTGVGVGTGVGLVKELTDIGKTGFSTDDLMWTFVGAAVSTWITDKIHYPNYLERKKEEVAEMERQRVANLTDEERLLEQIKLDNSRDNLTNSKALHK